MGCYVDSMVGICCKNASDEQIAALMKCLGFKRINDRDFSYSEAGEMMFNAKKDDGKIWFDTYNHDFEFDLDLDGEESHYKGQDLGLIYEMFSTLFGETEVYYQYESDSSGVDSYERIEEKIHGTDKNDAVIDVAVRNYSYGLYSVFNWELERPDDDEEEENLAEKGTVYYSNRYSANSSNLKCRQIIRNNTDKEACAELEKAFTSGNLNDNAKCRAVKNALYSKDMTKLIAVSREFEGNFEIPSGVTEISDYAFCGCTDLSSVVINEGMKAIGNSAFGGCKKLADITIPKSVTSIGSNAFSGTKWLKKQHG